VDDTDGGGSVASVPISLPAAPTPLHWCHAVAAGGESDDADVIEVVAPVASRAGSRAAGATTSLASGSRGARGLGGCGGDDDDEHDDGLALDVRRLSDGTHGQPAGGLLRLTGNGGFDPAKSGRPSSRGDGEDGDSDGTVDSLGNLLDESMRGAGIPDAAATPHPHPHGVTAVSHGSSGGVDVEPDAATKRALCAAAARRRLADNGTLSPDDWPPRHQPLPPTPWPSPWHPSPAPGGVSSNTTAAMDDDDL